MAVQQTLHKTITDKKQISPSLWVNL